MPHEVGTLTRFSHSPIPFELLQEIRDWPGHLFDALKRELLRRTCGRCQCNVWRLLISPVAVVAGLAETAGSKFLSERYLRRKPVFLAVALRWDPRDLFSDLCLRFGVWGPVSFTWQNVSSVAHVLCVLLINVMLRWVVIFFILRKSLRSLS